VIDAATPSIASTTAVSAEPPLASIVFVNTDTLLENYDFFKLKNEEFKKRGDQIRNELNVESNRLQADAEKYQQRAPSMTGEERAKTEEQLMTRQQNLMTRKDNLYAKLEEEQEKFQSELHERLNSFLKEYNKDKNYNFVLGYTKGGGILFANDSLDITPQMIEGLNKSGK
jgi:outer membrane protein